MSSLTKEKAQADLDKLFGYLIIQDFQGSKGVSTFYDTEIGSTFTGVYPRVRGGRVKHPLRNQILQKLL